MLKVTFDVIGCFNFCLSVCQQLLLTISPLERLCEILPEFVEMIVRWSFLEFVQLFEFYAEFQLPWRWNGKT